MKRTIRPKGAKATPKKRTTKDLKPQRQSTLTRKQQLEWNKQTNKASFLQLSNNVGRPRKIESPEHLISLVDEYFQWVEDNPFIEEKAAGSYLGEVVTHNVYKMRPRTLISMLNYIGMIHQTWLNYKERPEFLGVCKEIEAQIQDQKYQGAAAGFFNHAIIARDLGLIDRKDTTTDGQAINQVTVTHNVNFAKLPDKELKALVDIMSKITTEEIE